MTPLLFHCKDTTLVNYMYIVHVCGLYLQCKWLHINLPHKELTFRKFMKVLLL